jgi:pantoate--beta-alanine ligase
MEIFRNPVAMSVWSDAIRGEGKRIGLVPTMGYLHEAHLTLVRKARMLSDVVVASIFVNPTQFGPGEDFEKYPRDEEGDMRKLESVGVSSLYMPDPSSMYPSGYQTYVEVEGVSKGLCGDYRPGHFRGVATVVLKLFNAVKPHVALFGEKDYQQLVVIRRMARDLDVQVEIVGCELVREEDKIAMSSRNVYLSPDERLRALSLSKGLFAGKALYRSGERDACRIKEEVRRVIQSGDGVDIQYVEVRDGESLGSVDRIGSTAVIAVAARVGATRLIDNIILGRGEK